MGPSSDKGGRHVKLPDETPMANLLATILDKAGVPFIIFDHDNSDGSGVFVHLTRLPVFEWPSRALGRAAG